MAKIWTECKGCVYTHNCDNQLKGVSCSKIEDCKSYNGFALTDYGKLRKIKRSLNTKKGENKMAKVNFTVDELANGFLISVAGYSLEDGCYAIDCISGLESLVGEIVAKLIVNKEQPKKEVESKIKSTKIL